MESFLVDLLNIFVLSVFLLGVILVAIWFYFRIRPKQVTGLSAARPVEEHGKEVIMTLKLQACERLILFLERITPNNLILRIHDPDMTASQLHASLIRTVREEFDYNLSQQLYVTKTTWEKIRNAKEETISQLNRAASTLKEEGTPRDLAAAILQFSVGQERSPIAVAIEAIKQEII
ncbi:MAG: hypothetical protein D4R67_02415 [Bacteroidetes bacterium]|nr:MAG: hypothetical protein D4R67_02415 [Bacteroidota bacterium]